MKHKLPFLVLCLTMVTLFIIIKHTHGKGAPGMTQSLVITQGGRLTVVPPSEEYVRGLLVVETPKRTTNSTPSATNANTRK